MSAQEAAKALAAVLGSQGVLYQSDAIELLHRRWASFVKQNDNGTESVAKSVLVEFRKLTETSAIWDRANKCWRLRVTTDGQGRSSA